jgi:hypothetical protein
MQPHTRTEPISTDDNHWRSSLAFHGRPAGARRTRSLDRFAFPPRQYSTRRHDFSAAFLDGVANMLARQFLIAHRNLIDRDKSGATLWGAKSGAPAHSATPARRLRLVSVGPAPACRGRACPIGVVVTSREIERGPRDFVNDLSLVFSKTACCRPIQTDDSHLMLRRLDTIPCILAIPCLRCGGRRRQRAPEGHSDANLPGLTACGRGGSTCSAVLVIP